MAYGYRAGANYGFLSTNLAFSGGALEAALEMHSVGATFEVRPSPTWTFQVAAGGVLGGSFAVRGARYDVRPGVVGAVAVSARVLEGRGARPVVIVGGSLSMASASLAVDERDAPDRFLTMDLRVTAVAGWTIAATVTPYVAARAFGGPVFWRDGASDRTGTDVYHYQFAAGVVAVVAGRIDVYVEGAPLGERRVSAGAGVAF